MVPSAGRHHHGKSEPRCHRYGCGVTYNRGWGPTRGKSPYPLPPTRWEQEHVLETVQRRLDEHPEKICYTWYPPTRAREAHGMPATEERAWGAVDQERGTGSQEPSGMVGRNRHRAGDVRRACWGGPWRPLAQRSAPCGPCGDPWGRPGASGWWRSRGPRNNGGRVRPRRLGWGRCSLKPREAHTWRPPRRHGADLAGSRTACRTAQGRPGDPRQGAVRRRQRARRISALPTRPRRGRSRRAGRVCRPL
jgi:hypothetical protein